jgi:hypothetical protein
MNMQTRTISLIAIALTAGAASADHLQEFSAIITGDQQVPDPVMTDAMGTLSGTYDSNLNEFSFSWVIMGDLEGNPASPGAHLHNGAAGTNGPVVFGFNNPDGTWEMSGSATWSGLSQSEIDALYAGEIYVNFHTDAFPSGEIRGQLFAVPAPGATAVLGFAGAGAGLRRRR